MYEKCCEVFSFSHTVYSREEYLFDPSLLADGNVLSSALVFGVRLAGVPIVIEALVPVEGLAVFAVLRLTFLVATF